MPYLVTTTIPKRLAEKRDVLRANHLEYLESQLSKVLAAGARLDEDGTVGEGSFYLLEADTEAEARAFIAADPFAEAGLITSMSVIKVRKGFFNHKRETPVG